MEIAVDIPVAECTDGSDNVIASKANLDQHKLF